MSEPLSTQPYKGVRDFYPEDMAIQRYIFDVWSDTVESFGFERYDASPLEPAQLYRAKGAENEEMVNEQTYTFLDRGDREVTLRPEMTPTVARMIAARRDTLTPPTRWYSIPNLFRYERRQRGRLREHWQLNCDIFGVDSAAADIETIELIYQIFTVGFGATPDMFEIHINDRRTMQKAYELLGITDPDTITAITRVNDRKRKLDDTTYLSLLKEVVKDQSLAGEIKAMIETSDPGEHTIITNLRDLGIENVILDRSLARGFDYYTAVIFEVFDTAPENNRSLGGGGRYNDLTKLFGGKMVPGVGFGMGDVTMRDFIETHDLLPAELTDSSIDVVVIPLETDQHAPALKLAQQLRAKGFRVTVDYSDRKRDKRFQAARESGARYAVIFGPNEVHSGELTAQNLKKADASITANSTVFAEQLKQKF